MVQFSGKDIKYATSTLIDFKGLVQIESIYLDRMSSSFLKVIYTRSGMNGWTFHWRCLPLSVLSGWNYHFQWTFEKPRSECEDSNPLTRACFLNSLSIDASWWLYGIESISSLSMMHNSSPGKIFDKVHACIIVTALFIRRWCCP